jgi:hypothetical protein
MAGSTNLRLRGASLAGLLGASSVFFGLTPSEAQTAPPPTLDAQPRVVTAGSSVTVTGSCPPPNDAAVAGNLVVDPDAPRVEGFTGWMSVTTDANGAFTAAFPIPEDALPGVWQFHLVCSVGDVALHPPRVEVQVEPGSPVHIALSPAPDPAVTGQPLRVTGSGCVADGRPLDSSVASIANDDAEAVVNGTVVNHGGGRFEAIIDVPLDFPPGAATLTAACEDPEGPVPTWSRVLHEPIVVRAGSTDSTAPPTSPPTTGTLPRTGNPGGALPATIGLALMLAGLSSLAVARRSGRTSGT